MSEPVKVLPMAQLLRLAKEKEAKERAERESTQITAVPEYSSTTPIEEQLSEAEAFTKDDASDITEVPKYRSTPVIPREKFYKKANEVADHIDRTLTPAESKVFEQLIRLSIGFNKEICRVRVSVLMERTGYTSDKTVRAALRGLELKGRIKRLSARNSPLGDEYKILAYSGSTGVPEYRSTAAENTAVLGSKITGHLNTSIKDQNTDDEAFTELVEVFRQITRELTGKSPAATESPKWKELAEVLIAELRISAGRTTISSVPAFMAEHLRRRLWKIDKKQAVREGKELPDQISSTPQETSAGCPDCYGTGWWYPNGIDKGVAKCKHLKMLEEGKTEVE
ncbi:MAG: replication protein [Acidobacteria bacterium]|nr:replication protein [Acidobacteriota bacterium]